MADVNETKIVAVSGGIGSGKSAVCEILKSKGAVLFNADGVAKRLMQEDEALRAGIVEAFGSDSYRSNGTLDRGYLAQRVFADEAQRQVMNALVHPKVAEAFFAARDDAVATSAPLFVHESALITEVDHRDHFDAIVIVEGPDSLRVARVVARDAIAEEDVKARMELQPSREDYRRVADYIIVNDGSLELLESRVDRVLEQLAS